MHEGNMHKCVLPHVADSGGQSGFQSQGGLLPEGSAGPHPLQEQDQYSTATGTASAYAHHTHLPILNMQLPLSPSSPAHRYSHAAASVCIPA